MTEPANHWRWKMLHTFTGTTSPEQRQRQAAQWINRWCVLCGEPVRYTPDDDEPEICACTGASSAEYRGPLGGESARHVGRAHDIGYGDPKNERECFACSKGYNVPHTLGARCRYRAPAAGSRVPAPNDFVPFTFSAFDTKPRRR